MIVSRTYYLEPAKFIRDLVHKYINLTKFEIELIDTPQFQRLKDVRQLTCQHVYPAARHTRFEHSLGVMELTKQAIKHLNKNKFLGGQNVYGNQIINENLAFNASIAALLHDVGHCPFSHLGEIQVDKDNVRERLSNHIMSKLSNSELSNEFSVSSGKNIGSLHEQLSCIVIFEKFYGMLTGLNHKPIENKEGDGVELNVDFELIIRSILGMEYDTSTTDKYKEFNLHNVIVRLINSSIFDMDKLDYIMRDSFFTGIGTPQIDTKRLFRNMYFNHDFSIVFTSKAVPALQNMIDSRDELYMYVYNHHAVVFSDFMNTYIMRKLVHNSNDFLDLIYPEKTQQEKKTALSKLENTELGLIPTSHLFSIDSILEKNRSDSDWISLLNRIRYNKIAENEIWKLIDKIIENYKISNPFGLEIGDLDPDFNDKKQHLVEKITSTFNLLDRYHTRSFLKPWWKTVFEFTNFMKMSFRDDVVRNKVGEMICDGKKYNIDSAEFRSQIAKHVIYITTHLKNESILDYIEPFAEGDFFVVQRSNRFFDLRDIEKLDIALKTSEIIGTPSDIEYQTSIYYLKYLTNIIPQKDYSAIYAKEGFYIFSKQVDMEPSKKKKHYEEIERIFIFVVSEFINRGSHWFNDRFGVKDIAKEKKSMEELYFTYKEKYFNK